MAFFRRWFLLLFALSVGGSRCLAASSEERAYAAAAQAFSDKFYTLATNRLVQYLQNSFYRRSTNAPKAVLLLAQAEYYQQNYGDVTNRLADPANLARARGAGLADQYAYWRAEALLAQSNLPSAAAILVALPKNYPKSPLAVAAVVEAGRAYGKLGEWFRTDELLNDTNGVFQRAARNDPGNKAVIEGKLLQAQSMCVQRDYGPAIRLLDTLKVSMLAPDQAWNRAYWVYQADLGKNDLAAALAAATNMVGIAQAGVGDPWPTNFAESVLNQATLFELQGNKSGAAALLQDALHNSIPGGYREHMVLKLADLAMVQNQWTNAERTLETYLRQYPESPVAELVQVTLGELHLKDYMAQPSATNELQTAQAELAGIPTNSPYSGRAFLARGWCDWLLAEDAEGTHDFAAAQQAMTQSLADFGMAAELLPVSKDQAVAKFKMGDAQFWLNDFAGAETNYQAVLDDFSSVSELGNSIRSQALYQILRARLVLHDVEGADAVMEQLLKAYWTNAPVENSLLLVGQAFSDFNKPAKAREVFGRFEFECTNSPLLAKVRFAAAMTFERETNWTKAVAGLADWLRTYSTNDLRPQVEYERDWAVSQTGDETGAFQLFTNYIARFPASPNTPLADWWVAEHLFRAGITNYVDAERYYEPIFQDFPSNALARPAQLMAARAAMGRFDYARAIHSYLDPLVSDTNCPTDLAVQARFAYAEALRNLTDTNFVYLQTATNLLSQICALYPTNREGALAWSETGDCNLQMGAFDAATNAYAQAAFSPGATQELRYRAQIGWGLALEKKAEGLPPEAQKVLLDLAMQNYAAVFEPESDVPSEFWRKKAGLQILALNAKTKTLRGKDLEDFIFRLKSLFPQLAESPELKRLASKN